MPKILLTALCAASLTAAAAPVANEDAAFAAALAALEKHLRAFVARLEAEMKGLEQ